MGGDPESLRLTEDDEIGTVGRGGHDGGRSEIGECPGDDGGHRADLLGREAGLGSTIVVDAVAGVGEQHDRTIRAPANAAARHSSSRPPRPRSGDGRRVTIPR